MIQQGQATPKPNQDGPDRESARSIVLLAVLTIVVAVVVLAAHWPALSAEAIWFDDGQYLTENALVQNPSWSHAGRFLIEVLEPSTVKGYYQPLAMISLMVDHALGGSAENLRPFHLTSLVLHAGNTVLVMVLLYTLFGRPWVAAMVGLLFGVHPMTVETIPWVGERKTLLAAFFALGSLIAYVRYAKSTDGKLFTGCLVLYLLALMSKPTSLPLPVCLLLLDWWPLRRLSKPAVVEKLPFFLLAGVFAAITVISQARSAVVTTPVEQGTLRIPWILCHNIVFYLYKIVWPAQLSSHYPFPDPLSLSHPAVLAGVIGTCVLILALVVSLRWTRSLLVGWLFFFVAIFPTMGVIGFTIVIASDKYAYLPSVGLMLPLAFLLSRWWSDDDVVSRLRIRQVGLLLAVVFLATAETRATWHYLSVWRDSVTLHQYMIALAPDSAPLHNNLGLACARQGNLNKAEHHYRKTLEIDPAHVNAYYNLAIAMNRRGKMDEAMKLLEHSLRIDPRGYNAHSLLGNILVKQGKPREAATHHAAALRARPHHYQAHYNLGRTWAKCGKNAEAIKHLTEAIRLHNRYDHAHYYLANALLESDRVSEALEHFALVLEINPDYYEAYNNMAVVLVMTGQRDKAIDVFNQLLRRKPDDAPARANLASVLASMGRLDEAVAAYRLALKLQPSHAAWHYKLGNVLIRQGKINQAIAEYEKTLQINPDHAEARKELEAATTKRND